MHSDVESKPGSPAGLQLLTKKQVAKLLACSCRMVERLVASGTLSAVKIRMARRSRMSPMIGFSGNTLITLARIFEQAPAKLASGLLPGGPCPHSKFGGGCQTLSDQNQRERNALRVRLRDEQALDPLTFKFD